MRVLAISAHPDDETLGCGGTLLKHAAAGDSVEWLITTKPREGQYSAEFIAQRLKQIVAVQQAFGFSDTHQLDFYAAELEMAPFRHVVDAIRGAVQIAKPDRIYVVHPDDVHSDHRVTFSAVWAAAKPFRNAQVSEIFCYETVSSTNMAAPLAGRGFLPNAYCDISDFLERKLEIFGLYESEVQMSPGPRSPTALKALAQQRGSVVGIKYAEAFSTMRVLL